MSDKVEEYESRREKVGEFEINIRTYRLGETYYCKVDNVDPGALVARAEAKSREEAESAAVAKARERVGRTRVHDSEG